MGRTSNYENSLYNQLQEIMLRLDSVENELCTEIKERKQNNERLNAKTEKISLMLFC